jgi:predicted nuclease with TOPRIM domain
VRGGGRWAPHDQSAESLVLEHLNRFQATLDRVETKLGDLTVRVASLERHRALVHDDMPALNLRMDGFSKRMDRVERRLELTDAV